jgi:septum formation protein
VYHRAVRLVLASQSPRRAELLERAGFEFDVVSARIDEAPLAGETPRAHVARLAGAKAEAVARQLPARVVLGADTVVVVDNHLLGKPVDDQDAARMLRLLAGRVHEVLTGVVLQYADRAVSGVDTTRVRFTSLTDETIAWYVATGEPQGKAGAYAIQGAASRFVDWIEGSYTNVVGLPVALVDRLLHELFP